MTSKERPIQKEKKNFFFLLLTLGYFANDWGWENAKWGWYQSKRIPIRNHSWHLHSVLLFTESFSVSYCSEQSCKLGRWYFLSLIEWAWGQERVRELPWIIQTSCWQKKDFNASLNSVNHSFRYSTLPSSHFKQTN